MSRIDDLILEMCPNGVRWVPMGEAFVMRAGTHLAASLIQSEESDNNVIPVYGGNGLRGYGSSSTHIGEFLLIGRQGARCGNVHRVSGTFYATEHAVVTHVSDSVDTNFAFHLLTAMDLNQYKSSGAQPGLAVSNLASVPVPVPPLVVQQEIVAISDSFTQLQAELEAELEARRRQYEYYRDVLLGFHDQPDVRWVPIGDFGNWIGGITPSKRQRHYWDDGTIPWAASMDISATNGREIRGRVTQQALRETPLRLVSAPSVAVVMRSNILRRFLPIGLIEVDATANQDLRLLNAADGVNPRFVYQALLAASESIRRTCVRTDGSMAAVDSKAFFSYRVPVPSLDEQERIVATLDTFDALVNDLSIGLPAELKARRQQYEYYREKLLTFPEAA